MSPTDQAVDRTHPNKYALQIRLGRGKKNHVTWLKVNIELQNNRKKAGITVILNTDSSKGYVTYVCVFIWMCWISMTARLEVKRFM